MEAFDKVCHAGSSSTSQTTSFGRLGHCASHSVYCMGILFFVVAPKDRKGFEVSI